MSFAVSNYTPVPQVQVDIASHRRRTEQFPRTAGQASSLRPLILAARPPPATKPAREIPRKSNRDVRKEGFMTIFGRLLTSARDDREAHRAEGLLDTFDEPNRGRV